MIRFRLSAVEDWDAVGARWRELESRADCSFFQSWTWLGCLAAQRFNDPLLLEARDGDCVLALALFNRRRAKMFGVRLYLAETGDRTFDDLFIEFNGILMARGQDTALLARCFSVARENGSGALMLSGIDQTQFDAACAAGDVVRAHQTRDAPFVDIAGLRQRDVGFLASLHANSRYQLRRSARRYAEQGALQLARAESREQAETFLEELMRLHQASWQRRGRPGAFANPRFTEFHRALIARGTERDEIDLLRVTAGGRVVGLLYNFRHRGSVLAYQSGFDYDASDTQMKPGLTCHHLAVEHYLAVGAARYDFLAGDDRYKRSLATSATTLHWLELLPRWSPRALIERARDLGR